MSFWSAVGKFFLDVGKAVISYAVNNPVSFTLQAATLAVGVKGFMQAKQMLAKGQDILANKTSAGGKIPVIYGTRRVGAQIIYMDVNANDSRDLYVVYALAVGEVDEIIGKSIELDGNRLTDSARFRDGGYIGSDKIASGNYSLNTVSQNGTGIDAGAGQFGSSPTSKYRYVMNLHHGAATQTADPMLVASMPNWTSAHKLNGIAYIACHFGYDKEGIWSGVPQLTVQVRGKKVYDPRLDSTAGGSGSHRFNDVSTYAYSDNPVLCFLNYITDNEVGKGLTESQINMSTFSSAANVCDTEVDNPFFGGTSKSLTWSGNSGDSFITIGGSDPNGDWWQNKIGELIDIYDNNGDDVITGKEITDIQRDEFFDQNPLYRVYFNDTLGTNYSSQTTGSSLVKIKRFHCNGYLDTNKNVMENAKELLANMRGIFLYIDGKYELQIEDIGTSSFTITDDHIISDAGISIDYGNKDKKANKVIVEFFNANKKYELDTATVLHDATPEYYSDDNDEILEIKAEFPYITDPYIAYNMGKAILTRSRKQMTIQFLGTPEMYKLNVGDIVTLSYAGTFDETKTCRVEALELQPNGLVAVSLIEYFDVYTWQTPPEEPLEELANLPSAYAVKAPTNITFTDTNSSSTGRPFLSWDEPTDFPDYQYRVNVVDNSGNQVINRIVDVENCDLNFVPTGSYVANITSLNTLGTESSPARFPATGTFSIGDAPTDTADIQNDAITTPKILDNNVTDAKINSLTANKLTAGTIDASVITVTNLDADNITSGTIGADKILVDDLSAINSDLGAIDAGSINIGSGAFTVSSAGVMTATGATISGALTATSLNVTNATVTGTLDASVITLNGDPLDDLFGVSGTGSAKTLSIGPDVKNQLKVNGTSMQYVAYDQVQSDGDLAFEMDENSAIFYPDSSEGRPTQWEPTIIKAGDIEDNTNQSGITTPRVTATYSVSAQSLSASAHLFLTSLSSAPATTTNKLYNDGGTLYWNGSAVNTGAGDITGVTITTTGGSLTGGAAYTSGDATFTLDIGSTITGAKTFDNNVVIQGDLDVQGTTTTIDTTNLDVKDKNITLNYGTGDTSANANGAGITIQDAVSAGNDATLTWNTSDDTFNFSHDVIIGATDAGNKTLTISGGATGNAEGGEIRLATAADYDTTYDFYRIDVNQDDFRIGRAGTTDLTINSSGNATFAGSINSGAITSSSNITTQANSASAGIKIKRTNSSTAGAKGYIGFMDSDNNFVASIDSRGTGVNNSGDLRFTTSTGEAETGVYNLTPVLTLGTDQSATFAGSVSSGAITSTSSIKAASGGNVIELGTDGNIEITRTSGGAYIDFKDSSSEDYDQRIQANTTGHGFSGTINASNKVTISNANYNQHLEISRTGQGTFGLTPSGNQLLIIGGGFSPASNNAHDLGRTDKYWQDLWLGSTLKMGGQTVLDSSRNLTNIGTINTSGQITQTVAGSNYFRSIASSSGNAGLFMSNTARDWYILNNSAGTLELYDGTATSVRMSINTSGNTTFAGTISSGDIEPDSLSINSGGYRSEATEGTVYKYFLTGMGSVDNNWKKICDVAIGTGLYQALAMRIILESQGGNFGNTVNVEKVEYLGLYYRSAATQDSVNNAELAGINPTNHQLRIIKTSTGNYELQILMVNSFKDAIVEIEVLSTNGGTVTMATSISNGSTTGTVYSASANSNTKNIFNSIDVGTISSGSITTSGDINFGDNDKAVFGAGSDLQIYHDGSNSYIEDAGTGSLIIEGTDLNLRANDNSRYLVGTDGLGGSTALYHPDGDSIKLATTSTGIDVTGTVTADGLTVDGLAEISAQTNGAYALRVGDAAGSSGSVAGIGKIGINPQGAGTFTYTGTEIRATENALGDYRARLSFHTRGSTSDVEPLERLRIDQTGDISFYEDTGTTAKLFWDASAESLGIGTTSPQESIHTTGNIRFGDSAPAEIYTNSSELRLGVDRNNDNGTSDITFYTNNDEKVRIDADGNTTFTGTISSGAISANSSSTSTFAGSGYLNINANVGGIGTNGSHGLHIGWNKSNGGREINMIFDGGTTQADTEIIFTSTDGTNYSDIFQINGGGDVDIKNGGLRLANTTVIDSSRNLTNIGTISSGHVEINAGSTVNRFHCNQTSADDWQTSPISIRERGLNGNASTSSTYAPNLNFHWGSVVSKSLTMLSDGSFVLGEWGAGTPNTTSSLSTLNTGGYQINATTVIDSSRNLTNIASLNLNSKGSATSIPKTFAIANTSGNSNRYIKFGTISSIAQSGRSVKITVSANNGYNAANNQNTETIIRFKTSNNSSNQSGFYGDCQQYRYGRSTASPSDVLVKQVSSTEFEFYGLFGNFTGDGSIYTVEHNDGVWTHSGSDTGTTAPSGTVLTATRSSIFVSGTDNFNANLNIGTGTINSGTITSSGNIIKSGGTSSQFLKADGSVQSTSAGSPQGTTSPFNASANTLTFLINVAHLDGLVTGSQTGVLDLSTGELEINSQGEINIKANSIEASKIAANTITASEIASNTITGTQINADLLNVQHFDNVSADIKSHLTTETFVPLSREGQVYVQRTSPYTGSNASFFNLAITQVRNSATYVAIFSGVLGDVSGGRVQYSINGTTWVNASGNTNISWSAGTYRGYTYVYTGQITTLSGTQSTVYWRVYFSGSYNHTQLSLNVMMDNTQ